MSDVALVTGGSGALGTAVVGRLRADGFEVVVAERSGGGPEGVVLLHADVTDPASVDALVREVVARFGRIDALVHLVGGWAGGKPVHEHDVETWDRMQSLNLRSAFLLSRAVLPHMRERGSGRIVLVSSRSARSGRKGQSAYAVAKAGLAVLAETIAEENRDLDVTANVIAPSIIDTPANRESLTSDPATWVPPGDLAATIAFLVSKPAGQLRGAWLPVFGRA